MLPKVLEIFWGVKLDPCICLGETHSAPPPLCFAPSHALALLQALIAAWQICSSHGWSKPTHKPDPSGSQKRNIKVNPGGVGGCTHPFGSQTFGEILKWIFYKKRGISYDMKIWLKPPPSWKWTNRFTSQLLGFKFCIKIGGKQRDKPW